MIDGAIDFVVFSQGTQAKTLGKKTGSICKNETYFIQVNSLS